MANLSRVANGLQLIDGLISGTPTINLTQTTYTVWANNSGGSSSYQFDLVVNEPLTLVVYSSDNYTFTRTQLISTLSPTLTGGNAETWEIYPQLPTGMSFVNGDISGTPQENSTETMYQIWANNTGGSSSVWLNITVNEPIAVFEYNPANFNLTRGSLITDISPTSIGGMAASWSIEPNLPAGLTFENGEISGTPQINMTTTQFTIWANNSGGYYVQSINITIDEPIAVFNYQYYNYTFTRGQEIELIIPTITGGFAQNWEIMPQLPPGLIFDNGSIYGTSQTNQTGTEYTIWANNTGGSYNQSLHLTILEPVAEIQISSAEVTLNKSEAFGAIVIQNVGGVVETWEIYPPLPDGILFENGVVSGSPNVNSTEIEYTIYANNSGGSAEVKLTIEILELPPEIILSSLDYSFIEGLLIDRITPVSIGGAIEYWTIEPSLPLGMMFDSVNGNIFGTHEGLSENKNYTIRAVNSGGQFDISISIQVVSRPPEFSLPSAYLRYTEYVSILPFTPISTGGIVEIWSIESSIGGLPDGLYFDESTGTIQGTPTSSLDETTYSITAKNTGGDVTQIFVIEVLSDFDRDGIPDVEDQDDDNDGASDAEEIREDTDPFDNKSTPVEGFEILIPNTTISLGAWDLIGIIAGVPLASWMFFAISTRGKEQVNSRRVSRKPLQ